jgi:glycerol-3-phosphate cytidylyltransferase-like family protein
VAGHFDPLLAEHVRLLRRHSGPNQKLVVEITNPSQPLLPQKARAELVAALEMVDYVVLKSSGSPSTGALDSGITERFIQQVSRRHGGEGAA